MIEIKHLVDSVCWKMALLQGALAASLMVQAGGDTKYKFPF